MINLAMLNTNVLLFLYFWGKSNFSESALYQREMVGLTNFRPDMYCIVNVMISIKKYLSKVFRISFDELLKVTTLLVPNIFLNLQIPM